MNRIVLRQMAAALCAAALLAGCSGEPAEISASGDEDGAHEVLKTVLEAWKSGKKPEHLKNERPAYHVADEDWQAGKALKLFAATEAPTAQGGHWRVSAVLTLVGDGQPEEQKQVAYSVTTEPAITVLRLEEGN